MEKILTALTPKRLALKEVKSLQYCQGISLSNTWVTAGVLPARLQQQWTEENSGLEARDSTSTLKPCQIQVL